VPTEVTDLDAADLEDAEEMFLTNAITGVRPVGEVVGIRRYDAAGVVTRALIEQTARAGG
jgi:branched-subunit amino acid aminotransferase/4-amino-4-deoxychorismate lyase